MFYLRLFGGVVLSGLDGPLPHPLTQQRVLAALAILAAAPSGRLSRDQLAELLWPDKASRNARHRLADTLHQLRKALGHEIIRSAGNDVELNRKVLSSDVHEFEAAFRAGNFDRSVALYRGPFADGFFVSHAPDFERWVDGTRQRLAQSYAEAVHELAAQAEA